MGDIFNFCAIPGRRSGRSQVGWSLTWAIDSFIVSSRDPVDMEPVRDCSAAIRAMAVRFMIMVATIAVLRFIQLQSFLGVDQSFTVTTTTRPP